MIYENKIKINNMISNITDKVIMKKIFNLVRHELSISNDCRYTHNNNGIYFNLNLLSDTTLEKIEEIIKTSIVNQIDSIKLNIYSSDSITDYTKKLSNKERTLINLFQKDN